MAYDKAVDSAVLDAGLTAIANAIREKGGTSDPIAFDAMANAIAAIKSGGGAGFATGTLTFNESQGTTSDLTVTHNLGFAPDHILWSIIETEAKSSNKFYADNYPVSFEYISQEAYLTNSKGSSSKTDTLEYNVITSGNYLNMINNAKSNEKTIKLFFAYAWRYSNNIPASSTIRWFVW